MHKYENEYNLLLKQREQLIGSIQQANKSFHTAVFSALTVLSMVLTLLFHSNDPLSGWYLFLLAQVVLGLFFFVAGLLFSTNNDRDYIRAIDAYLRERYQVKVLFYQGELSYRHINHVGSAFSMLTTAGAVVTGLLLACGLVLRWAEIQSIMVSYPLPTLIVLLEIVVGILFLVRNFRYKLTARSSYYSDTLEFLRRGELAPLGAERNHRK